MTEEKERKKGELINFMAEAARRGKKPAESKPSIAIKGDGNIVGNNNQVRITVQAKPAVKVLVTPGAQHISTAQAAEIREMVNRLAQLQSHSHQQIWTTLKRTFGFATYHLLPAEQFPAVHAYLRARLAKTPAPPGRKSLLARIHAQAKKRPDGIAQVKATAAQHFGTPSLSALTDDQLRTLIQLAGL